MKKRMFARLFTLAVMAVLSGLGAKTVNALGFGPCDIACFGATGSLQGCSSCNKGSGPTSCWVTGTGCTGGRCGVHQANTSCTIYQF